MNSQKTLKKIIPFLIFIAVIGIWFVKNLQEQTAVYDESNLAYPLTVASVDIAQLSKNNMPIIVDFGADECVPCVAMAPVLQKLNAEMQNKAIIQFVDVWKNPEAANNFPVQVIPTQILYTADGKPYVPTDGIGISFTLYSTPDTNEHIFTVHQGGLTEEQMRIILADMGVN